MVETKPKDGGVPDMPDTPPAPPKNTKNALVHVRVLRAIDIGGLTIRPIVDDGPRAAGRPLPVKPVEAYIPRDLAESFGKRYVEIIGDAPAGAKIGPVEKKD